MKRNPEERERYFSLLEKELAEDAALSDEELAFAQSMERGDPECASFAAALDEMRAPEPLKREMIERAVAEHWGGAHRRRGRLIAVCGAVVAAAAVVAVAFATGVFQDGGSRLRPASIESPTFALYDAQGSRRGVGQVFEAGEEPGLLRDQGDLSVGVDRDSGLEILSAQRDVVSLRLREGRAAFHLRPGAARGLRVRTPLCDVVVTGTVFSVEVAAKEVRVGVARGSVSIAGPDGEVLSHVEAGEMLSVAANSKIELVPGERAHMLALLGMPESGAAASLREAAAEAACEMGVAPSGEEGPAARQAGSPAASARAHGAAETQKASEAKEIEKSTPAEMIRLAREHVRERDWNAAAGLYRTIVRDYPDLPESVTVRVSLADLELDHLGSPSSALIDYQAYLSRNPDGPLAEDALWGICSAYGRLGQISKERQCISGFLARFSQSVHTRSAQQRLMSLENGQKKE